MEVKNTYLVKSESVRNYFDDINLKDDSRVNEFLIPLTHISSSYKYIQIDTQVRSPLNGQIIELNHIFETNDFDDVNVKAVFLKTETTLITIKF